MKDYKVMQIKSQETYDWLLNKHYLKRLAPIMYSYGLYKDTTLIGVCTYGVPASGSLCRGVCGEEYKFMVLELNRLCINEDRQKNAPSYFVAKTLNLLPKPNIIVSYADTNQNHIGYIYQATNWIYTGLSAKRTDCKIVGEENNGRHSRHLFDKYGGINNIKEKYPDKVKWVDRPQKHRYLYFLGTKKQIKQFKNNLNYPILPYPKGESKKYDASYKPITQEILF